MKHYKRHVKDIRLGLFFKPFSQLPDPIMKNVSKPFSNPIYVINDTS